MPSGDDPATASDGTLRAHIDPELCVGSGICLATAPRHFEPTMDARSRARPDAPPADDRAQDAAALCPMEAIHFVRAREPTPRTAPPEARS
ncbi:ferredoxin [Streptomyces olivoreticuli]|uniref:ferredoxin n=1 Tax=Streptomyces olivoreticuli TaxID=68246 RepID=UPI000E24D828|nr:ferredoxin [Streptomyces olivoreticuli]